MAVTIGVAELPDKIQNPLLLWQVCVDLYVSNIPQGFRVNRSYIHVPHGCKYIFSSKLEYNRPFDTFIKNKYFVIAEKSFSLGQ